MDPEVCVKNAFEIALRVPGTKVMCSFRSKGYVRNVLSLSTVILLVNFLQVPMDIALRRIP